jgi:hypothetical protein
VNISLILNADININLTLPKRPTARQNFLYRDFIVWGIYLIGQGYLCEIDSLKRVIKIYEKNKDPIQNKGSLKIYYCDSFQPEEVLTFTVSASCQVPPALT